ncbi:Zinc finger CCHC domain-containing protein 8 [Morella rubra]|uniref:Zinc finger CCHC domain-containing protein 8 n=1 Tax=Morella rubra TaxID=262757 RepID=A0A6A1VEM1_9ROSI|nr:Zinc finger CCHC domain-containing protein 8 [Morella rubra]KAB1211161.1 Zinc finger CCHC domain-containing protein 8 [Morella rubra]
MEIEDSSIDYGHGSENNELHDSDYGPIEDEPSNSVHKEDELNSENCFHEDDAQCEDSHVVAEADLKEDLVDDNSDMETEDLISIPTSRDSGRGGIEDTEIHSPGPRPSEYVSQPSKSADRELVLNCENLNDNGSDILYENDNSIREGALNNNLVDLPSLMQRSVELTETVTVAGELNSISSTVHAKNGCLAVRDESPVVSHKMDAVSGVKRARMTFDEQKPSVRVMYFSLTRSSRQKLEELLQQWSLWHAQHGSSSQDPNEVLESGEEMFFPALHVGMEKKSAVSYWMDNQTSKQQNKEFIPLDGNSVPLYDRGFALGLTSVEGSSNVEKGLEIIDDASRCFNCGSYNHSLKECPKPRDNVAVNNARKQLKSKRNQNAGSRNPTRYYQNTPGGKYDGLRPGALNAETRHLLGLGELDPPPWLHRMREIGYPPGYLDPDDEDQPSGITIYADGENKEEQEDGEIIETDYPEPQRKMTVQFPGVNAPIPENADERLWAAGPSSLDLSRNRMHRRLNHYSEPVSRGNHREQRWSRDFPDDGPPGCEPGYSSSLSSYLPRYSDYDSGYDSYSPRSNISRPRSPPFGRSMSDRGKRSPLFDEGPLNDPLRRDYGSGRYENRTDEARNDYGRDFSSHSKDTQDRHYYRSRR